MKIKYLIILFLVLVLAVVVYEMLRMEDARIRDIQTAVADEPESPVQLLSREELVKIHDKVNYYAIAGNDYFNVLQPRIDEGNNKKVWERLYLKGVNIGVAMPGYFPVEFSLTFQDYLTWLTDIGKMNSNAIRVYTILPPAFYDALAFYNLHNHDRKLYLIQGVWAEEPADRNYFNKEFVNKYQAEIKKTVDVINGNAVLKPKPGHADGVYVSNVSKFVIGLLLGREWEPKSVLFTNNINKGVTKYTGNFVTINEGTAMEVWLARMMDFAVHYETQTYLAQHPVSFVNWLPLDPMSHNFEFTDSEKIREYDNDLVSLDFLKFNSTELFIPGIYAAYHVYPYYPDYIYLEKKYRNFQNGKGEDDNFLGYLTDLKKHNGSLPLLIAEYGLPSARGISHYNTQGYNQGGHSELEQAHLSSILTDDIYKSKCAGGLFFEWIDEWYKHNWLVMDFEQPAERSKLWHNLENPEQNYGIMAVESRTKTIDGVLNDWKDVPDARSKNFIIADADAAYFYLALHLPAFDLSENSLYVAFDTYDKNKGDHKLSFLAKELNRGIEFLLKIKSFSDARILVDDAYAVYTDVVKNINPVYASQYNNNGVFVDQLLLANRGKESILGEKVDSVCFDRGILYFGNSGLPQNSNADWYWNSKTKNLEIRFTWQLLNVSDPSSRSVLDDIAGTDKIEYSQTSGFNIYYYVTDKKDKLIDEKGDVKPYFYSWSTWEMPAFKTRLKPIYDTLKTVFAGLVIPPKDTTIKSPAAQKVTICNFFENKPGAISITFDDADYSQFEYALPVLGKYSLKANFGIVSSWLGETPTLIAEEGSFAIKRLGLPQVQDIIYEGHEISFHGKDHKVYENLSSDALAKEFLEAKQGLENKLGVLIPVIHYPFSKSSDKIIKAAQTAGFIIGRTGENANADNVNGNMMKLNSIVFLNAQTPTINQLDSMITKNTNSWTILLYHHIFPEVSKEYKLYSAHNVTNTYTVTPADFVKQIRLVRNSGYWIATLSQVGKYIQERKNAVIKSSSNGNSIFLRVDCRLNPDFYNFPLTIMMETNYKRFRITNCAADGIYNSFNGKLQFNVYPNKDVTIEILDI